jgi:hypothetical protein
MVVHFYLKGEESRSELRGIIKGNSRNGGCPPLAIHPCSKLHSILAFTHKCVTEFWPPICVRRLLPQSV